MRPNMQRCKALPAGHLAPKGASRTSLLSPAVLCVMMLMISSIFLPRLYAQAANGVITGRVIDPSGAVLTGTHVTLTRTDTGLVLHATTNGEGIYSFPS